METSERVVAAAPEYPRSWEMHAKARPLLRTPLCPPRPPPRVLMSASRGRQAHAQMQVWTTASQSWMFAARLHGATEVRHATRTSSSRRLLSPCARALSTPLHASSPCSARRACVQIPLPPA